jgi:redox-sensing transcriptional repressor
MISNRTIGRLSLYRRLLSEAAHDGVEHLFSHELASRAGCSAAQVRRDIMAVGYTGTPVRGYDVQELLGSIAKFLDAPANKRFVLVGIGNIGRAALSHFAARGKHISIVAGFDADAMKTNRVIHGCHCYGMGDLEDVVARTGAEVGIIAVPSDAAQDVADRLCATGIRGLVNFAPVRLRVPEGVYVETVDLTMALERAAFFAVHRSAAAGYAT